MRSNTTLPKKRLASLDAFRGFTIAAMIIVNTPGSWQHIYAPFRHAEWNGLTPTDLIFPFFLFIVGVSITFAFSKKKETVSHTVLIKQIIKRAIMLFLIGIGLNVIGSGFSELRLPGVLQRIAVVFLICSMLFLSVKKKTLVYVGLFILAFYWFIMKYIPVPGYGAGVLEPGKNLANYIDSMVIPFKMFQGTWDPEGLLSTIPAIATTITGIMTGFIIQAKQSHQYKLQRIFGIGTILLILGILVNYSFPINKNLWSSSYVLVTSGLANIALGTIYYLMDVKDHMKWGKAGVIFGTNAITAYIIHYLLMIPLTQIKFGGFNIQQHFMQNSLELGIAPETASLCWAISYVILCFIPIVELYKKKIFLKV